MMLSLLASQAQEATDPSPWLEVFGRAHPVLLHSPLGLLPALFLLEFGAVALRKTPPRGAIVAIAWLCAVTGAAAAASGLVLGAEHSGDTVAQHKLLGIVLGVLCLVTAGLSGLRDRRAFRVALLVSCVVMFPAGHLGGSVTRGSEFLFAPLQAKVEVPPPAATDRDYQHIIAPILERTCSKCHGPKKQKADLLLTSADGIRKGSENGAVLIPGKPDESSLLTLCELPLDDDDHMPPSDEEQPTAVELAALRAWIAAGAKFD